MLPVVRIVDESTEMHAVACGEVAQQVERADLVALVGRIRNAVREEQQTFVHPGLSKRP